MKVDFRTFKIKILISTKNLEHGRKKLIKLEHKYLR